MPNAEQIEIATKFVEVVRANMPWVNAGELLPGEVAMLFQLVEIAGFEPVRMEKRTLCRQTAFDPLDGRCHHRRVNDRCPYMVVGVGEEDHFPATVWLEQMVELCEDILESTGDDAVGVIARYIEQSVPLPPVMLTREGDMLEEHTPSGMGISVEHTRDANPLSDAEGCVGLHRFCRGFMDRRRATEHSDTLVCRKCHLRVYIPRDTATYGALRAALLLRISPRDATNGC